MILQFDRDLRADVLKLVNGIRKERSTSGQIAQLVNDCPAGLAGTQLGTPIADNTDCKDLNILFAQKFPNIRKRITAAVVLAIGDEQQRFLRITAFLDSFQADVNGIIEGGHSLRPREHEPALEASNVCREILGDFRAIAEFDQKVFILGIARLKERHGGITGDRQLVFHAAAHIKNNSETERDLL